MKTKHILLFVFLFFITGITGYSQDTLNDGKWSDHSVILYNTPQAELMVRVGDIDNLNFGWPANFDPFSGRSTPRHGYPWAIDSDDPGGTDRIMVLSSYTGTPPNGRDGYTSSTSRPSNSVRPITLSYQLDTIQVKSAIIQMFVDDFQAPVWKASYEVYLNNVRVPFMESSINALVQTGPIGKIINVEIPAEYLYLIRNDSCSILIDDNRTGAGDGYAIDFVKLLVNPSDIGQYATIKGKIINSSNGIPLDSVEVIANGRRRAMTDSAGNYQIDSILAGIASVRTYKRGFGEQTKTISLFAGQTGTLNFSLSTPSPKVIATVPANNAMVLDPAQKIHVRFNEKMNTSTINSSTFILTSNTKTVIGSILHTDTSFTFTPGENLELSTNYTATVKSTVRNIFGTNMEADYQWTFTTRGPDLQDRIDVAASGDSIKLGEMTYLGRGDTYVDPTCGNCDVPTYNIPVTKGIIIKDKEIHLVGSSQKNSIIETRGGYGVIFDNAGNSSISKLTITGGVNDTSGLATDAGIVVRNTKLKISHVKIADNAPNNYDYPVVGGVAIREGADVLVEHCSIINNSWDGIALYRGDPYGAPARATIQDNTIGWNKDNNYNSASAIGTTHDSRATIIGNSIYRFWKGIGAHGNSTISARNNIIRDMKGWGLACRPDATMQAVNNVIVNCNRTGIISYASNNSSYFINNIISNCGKGTYNAGNEPWPSCGVLFSSVTPPYGFSYNDVWDNAGGRNVILADSTPVAFNGTNGNISSDPVFTDPVNNNYHLLCSSPAINTGDPSISDRDASRSDMGVYGGLDSRQDPPDCSVNLSREIQRDISKFALVVGPNPIRSQATISYELKKASKVELNIYSLDGQKLTNLVNQKQLKGKNVVGLSSILPNGTILKPGHYILELKTADIKITEKIIILN